MAPLCLQNTQKLTFLKQPCPSTNSVYSRGLVLVSLLRRCTTAALHDGH